jgi:hypothetical protein
MSEKEVEINGKKIGEGTKITLTVSTLIWIIGILVSVVVTLATIGYFDIKSDVDTIENAADREKVEYKEEIRTLIQDELKYEREKREQIQEDIGEIKGDIKVILEKTKNLENGSSGNNFYNMNHSPVSGDTPPSSSMPPVN